MCVSHRIGEMLSRFFTENVALKEMRVSMHAWDFQPCHQAYILSTQLGGKDFNLILAFSGRPTMSWITMLANNELVG